MKLTAPIEIEKMKCLQPMQSQRTFKILNEFGFKSYSMSARHLIEQKTVNRVFSKSKIDNKISQQVTKSIIASKVDLLVKDSLPIKEYITPEAPLELDVKPKITVYEQSASSARLHDSHLSNRVSRRSPTGNQKQLSGRSFGLTVASTRLNFSSNVSLGSPIEEVAASPRVIRKEEPFELLQNQLNSTQDLKIMESKQDSTFKILKRRLWSNSNDFSSKRLVTNFVDKPAE